jgi:hypothetical protein
VDKLGAVQDVLSEDVNKRYVVAFDDGSVESIPRPLWFDTRVLGDPLRPVFPKKGDRMKVRFAEGAEPVVLEVTVSLVIKRP